MCLYFLAEAVFFHIVLYTFVLELSQTARNYFALVDFIARYYSETKVLQSFWLNEAGLRGFIASISLLFISRTAHSILQMPFISFVFNSQKFMMIDICPCQYFSRYCFSSAATLCIINFARTSGA